MTLIVMEKAFHVFQVAEIIIKIWIKTPTKRGETRFKGDLITSGKISPPVATLQFSIKSRLFFGYFVYKTVE